MWNREEEEEGEDEPWNLILLNDPGFALYVGSVFVSFLFLTLYPCTNVPLFFPL